MDVNYFWNIFLNYLTESIWINDENLKMNVIKNFIEALNIENLIGNINLDKTILEKITSSQGNNSSSQSNEKNKFFEFNNHRNIFEYICDSENFQDFNENIIEPETNINSIPLDYQKNDINIYVEDLKNKFKNIKDNINPDKTIHLRKEIFHKFMDFFHIKYDYL